jgi:hypothetical protein
MQDFTAQPWDAKTLKDALQAGLERQKMAQFKQDWNLAVVEAVRRVSNAVEHHVGNTIPCTLLSEREWTHGKMPRLVKSFYVRIQQERRAAVHERRPPRVTGAVANYRPWTG